MSNILTEEKRLELNIKHIIDFDDLYDESKVTALMEQIVFRGLVTSTKLSDYLLHPIGSFLSVVNNALFKANYKGEEVSWASAFEKVTASFVNSYFSLPHLQTTRNLNILADSINQSINNLEYQYTLTEKDANFYTVMFFHRCLEHIAMKLDSISETQTGSYEIVVNPESSLEATSAAN